MKSSPLPGHLMRSLILLVALVVIAYCSWNIYALEIRRRTFKEDLIELSKIKYGLFSVDEWKQILSSILAKKIEELDFDPQQKEEMKTKISDFLLRTITDFESHYYEEKSQSLTGWLESGVASFTGLFDELKKRVPVFTEQILDFLNDPGNRDKVKGYIMEKLTEYTDKTFSKIDYTEHNRILRLYTFGDRPQTISGLQQEIETLRVKSQRFIISVFIVCFLCGLLIISGSSFRQIEFLVFTVICLCLLGGGLVLPMIEIDARIEEMSFSLLGETVAFKDQVLYYKSKSILEVVRLMVSQGKWDVVLVGLLVLLFSVLFPLSKLLSSIAFIYNPSLSSNRFVRFMVFRTGKWSMADVMVIAIFMSYIGFSGVLTEQLNQLEGIARRLDILTTNKSSLRVGFFMFTFFAILSLLVAHQLQYKKQEYTS